MVVLRAQRAATRRLLVIVVVVASMPVGLLGGMSPAYADGSCTASGTISQIPPTVQVPNPPVTITGHVTCSTTHRMGLTTHLTLDCGYSCTDVKTGGGSAGTVTGTTHNSTDTYNPSACPPVPTTLFGETHTWYLFVYAYVENVGSPGWHSASGYTSLTFRCPGIIA